LPKSRSTASSPAGIAIADLFDVSSRFTRSVQLERDYDDPHALDQYIVTPTMAAAFQRIARGLAAGSRQRAWRVTGDYGVGKSSLALTLAHVLAGDGNSRASALADRLGWSGMEAPAPLWPLLVTGSRESLSVALARGIEDGLERRRKGRLTRPLAVLLDRARSIQVRPDADAAMALLESVKDLAEEQGAGLLLVIDELGKLLEFAAGEPDREDVYLLQKLGELAARSGDTPVLVVGLLHQGFQAYAERLPALVRHEWGKIAGRFEEIVLDQPLAHTAALVAGALGVNAGRLDPDILAAARKTAAATASMGWMSGDTSAALTLETAQLYPLHPTLLPPLVRFFARFGQNERSLFGFLLSSEPFGLQAFSTRGAEASEWYGLPEFYDYVRAMFGHGLAGASYQSNWLRISATVDTAHDLTSLELRSLKCIAVLSLLDSPELPATDIAIRACMSPARPADVDHALTGLVDRGLLFRRGRLGGYRLWPNTSVNLHTELEAAERAVGEVEVVGAAVAGLLSPDPILARRHYIERGTLRYFEVRYTPFSKAAEAAKGPTAADGLVLVVLADTKEEEARVRDLAQTSEIAGDDGLVIGVTRPLAALAGDVKALLAWRWVKAHTPELAHDPYAASEVVRQISAGERALDQALGVSAALRRRGGGGVRWMCQGEDLETDQGLSHRLSELCNVRFAAAPTISNELLNRKQLSSPAAAARMRLIEALYAAPEARYFGIDATKAPPEKSMFLSVIQEGRLQAEGLGGGYHLTLPSSGDDPLNLRPSLDAIEQLLSGAQGDRIGVSTVFRRLAEMGVRAGVAPLLLAFVMKLRSHELAIYENGTFRSAFAGPDFVRLIKAPTTFEIQLCRIEGVRGEVFARLVAAFADPERVERAQILDVVQPLARFAARLPDYSRKAGRLSPETVRVRDVLLTATEPAGLLFRDLPAACGLEPFGEMTPETEGRSDLFVARLQAAVEELRMDYARLLQRIIDTAAAALALDGDFDRARIAQRAARVANLAVAPRLRTFALRLRDANTSDEAWAEALGSFLIAKPPARWGATDEARCLDELSAVSQLFHRVETAAFENGVDGETDGLLVKLTQATGDDRGLVIRSGALSRPALAAVETIRKTLETRSQAERLQILAELLWTDLPQDAVEAQDRKVGTA
jgi:hypothetical protein